MLRLTLFGGFRAADESGREIAIKSRKARALLAYLALPTGKARSREALMALLWSERGEEQARASLRQALSGLRKDLGKGSGGSALDALCITEETLKLDGDLVAVEPAASGEVLLEGLHVNDPAFEEWLRDERLHREEPGPEGGAAQKPERAGRPFREAPSIAVLPFVNLSRDDGQEYFADGITEDIITELNRFQPLFVIARNSSFAFKGQAIEPAEAGRKLDVQFIVQGSVRKSGNRLRISAQLIEAETGNHLWAERYDRDLADIFAVQDEVASTVATMVPGHVEIAKRIQSERQTTKDTDAYDLVLRASWFLYNDFASSEAERLLLKALAIDPTYAVAHAKLAIYYAYGLFVDGQSIRDVSAKTRRHGEAATRHASGNAMVHAILGEAYVMIGEHTLAAHHVDKALSLNPNGFEIMTHAAEVKACLGDPQAGLELIDRALQNDPYGSMSYRENKFDINYIAGRYETALEQLIGWPEPPLHMILSKAAALAQSGRMAEAGAEVRHFESKRPAHWDKAEIAHAYGRMCANPKDGERWLEGFRKAGLKF